MHLLRDYYRRSLMFPDPFVFQHVPKCPDESHILTKANEEPTTK